MSLPGTDQVTRIIADAYYEAAMAQVNMRNASDALEKIRSSILKDQVFKILQTLDEQVGKSDTDRLQKILVELRHQFQQYVVKNTIEELHEFFDHNQEDGWKRWIRTYSDLLVNWQVPFYKQLVEENFPFGDEKKGESQKLLDLSSYVIREQWPEAFPIYPYLSEQTVLPKLNRARHLVIAGEIQLYHYLDPEKAFELFIAARELKPDDFRVICGIGEYWLEQGDFDIAEEQFKKTIQADPHKADGYLYMGECYEKQDNIEFAEDYYQDSIRMDPGDSEGYLRLIRLYSLPELFPRHENRMMPLFRNAIAVDPNCEYTACLDMGYAYEMNGKPDEAYPWYDRTIALDPARVTGYTSKGYAQLAEGKYEEARANFQKAVDAAPDIFDGYWAMTWLLESREDFENALKWYKKCLELRPQWEGIIRGKIGELYRKTGRYEEAEKELLTALRLDIQNRIILQSLVDLANMFYKQQENPEAAIRIYEQIRNIKGEEYEAEYQNNLGNIHYFNSDYEQAVSYFRNAIAEEPNSVVYHTNLTDSYVKLNRYDDAITSCQKVLDLEPDNADYLNTLGNIYYWTDRSQEAIEWYEKAIEYSPDTAVYYSNLGLSHRTLHNWMEAETAYQKALELDPKNPDHLNMLGVVNYGMSKDEQAINYYKKAIELDPNTGIYHANLGLVYRDTGELEKAAERYQKALELEPDNANYMNMLGSIRYLEQNYDKAIDWAKKAVAIEPENAEYHANLALAYQETGLLEMAEETLMKVIDLDPENPNSWNNVGLFHFNNLNYEKAIEFYKKAIELEPNSEIYHTNLGLAHRYLNNFEAARNASQRSLDLNPENADNWNNMGLCFYDQADYENAKKYFLKAVERAPDVVVYQVNYALALELNGEHEESERAYLKAAELDPANPEMWYALGTLSLNRHKYEQAAYYYKNAVVLSPDVPNYRLNLYFACERIDDEDKLRSTLESLPDTLAGEFAPLLDNLKGGTQNS